MQRLILYSLIAIGLSGCIAPVRTPPPSTVTVSLPVELKTESLITPPLVSTQEQLTYMNDEMLFDYVTTLNWEMFRNYSTVRVVNQYATSRGWSSPDTTPICRYARIPELPDLKDFDAKKVKDGDELTELLLVYIYDIQSESEITKAVFDENLSKLQYFCIY